MEDDDEEGHMLFTRMNMTQLAFIKRLESVERVRTDEGHNPFLMEEAEQPATVAETPATTAEPQTVEAMQAEQVMTLAADEMVEVEPIMANADDGIAVACVGGSSSSCSCPANKDMQSAQEIQVESSVSGRICCPGAEQWFKFTVPETKQYTIYTDSSLDTVGTLHGCCLPKAVTNDDFAGKLDFRIVKTLYAGFVYYIQVGANHNATGSYTLRVTDNIFAEKVLIHSQRSDGIILLEKGKTYELPRGQGYGFLNIAGTVNAPLSVKVTPPATTDKRVYWYASSIPSDPVEIDYDWYDNTTKYQTIKANSVGATKLYACDWYERCKSGMAYVVVIPPNELLVKATGISLDYTSLTLEIGEYQNITATVSPGTATVKDVDWESDNPSVATVTPFGRVKAIAPGTATIRAKAMDGSGVSQTCEVRVHDPFVNGLPMIVKCSSGLSVMSAASGGSVLGTFADGTTITLVNQIPQNKFMFYVYGIMSNGVPTYGWCSGGYLGNYIEYGTLVDVDALTVRAGVGEKYSKLGTIYKGDSVAVLAKNLSSADSEYIWLMIRYNDSDGYVVAGNNTPNFDFEIKWTALTNKDASALTPIAGNKGLNQSEMENNAVIIYDYLQNKVAIPWSK